VLSTFIVALRHPQMLGAKMQSDIMGISATLASDSVETRTNNLLLYYVMSADQGS